MSNTAHTDIHAEWVDSMAAWAEENAAELRHFTGTAHRAQPLPTPHYTAPQGRVEQGWPVRRSSPEMACWDSTKDDQTDSADAEVFAWLLKGLAVVLLAMLSAWCIASYLELAHV